MQGLGGVSLRNLGCETLPLLGLLRVGAGGWEDVYPCKQRAEPAGCPAPALGELDAFSKQFWLFWLFRTFPG